MERVVPLCIEILTTTGCSKCLKAKGTTTKIIGEFGDQIEYQEINIAEQPEKLVQFGVISFRRIGDISLLN